MHIAIDPLIAPPRPQVRLNVFQRLIRSWETVHPYNAAQVLKISGQADMGAIDRAWQRALYALGLGPVEAAGGVYRFSHGDTRFAVRELPVETHLADHLSLAINEPFDHPNEPPFRPFVISGPDAFHFGVVYQHWVADSISIRLLLREWFLQLDQPSLSGRGRPDLSDDGYWNLFGPRAARRSPVQNVMSLLRSYTAFRTVQKVALSGAADYPSRVLLKTLPAPFVQNLRSAVRPHSATVGDALQAALAIACHQHMPLQRRPSRRDLAVGSIVDLRPHARRDLSGAFGMYLGFSHVVCRSHHLRDFPRLLQSVSRQNRARQRDGVAQASLAWMLAAWTVHRFGKPSNLYRFYRKEMPLAAGLSNVNLAGAWPDSIGPDDARLSSPEPSDRAILDYLRVSPTGPMAPLVLSATTFGGAMRLAVSYRTSLFNEPQATELTQCVVDCLASITG